MEKIYNLNMIEIFTDLNIRYLNEIIKLIN